VLVALLVVAIIGWAVLAAVTVVFVRRRRTASTQRRDALSLLREFARAVATGVDSGPTAHAVLHQVKLITGARQVELTTINPTGRARRMTVDEDGQLSGSTVSLGLDSLERRTVAEGGALVARSSRGDRDPEEIRFLEERRAHDVMIAPLPLGEGAVGTLALVDSGGGGLGERDLDLIGSVAAYAAVALRNDRLVIQLRQEAAEREYRAFHDQLTGLPNRTMFAERIGEAIGVANGGPLAVLMVDLDRLKEVNDTLGHHNGDLVLREAAGRLVQAVGSRGTVARLSGDEFGVVLPRADRAGAVATAGHLRATLELPLELEGLTFEIGASLGVALHPEHGTDSTTLIQRADVAVNAAKAGHTEIHVYAPEHDPHTPRRLALVGELRQALDRGDLVVHYQPVATLETGQIIGVEALIRWHHPRHGLLAPDEFIPMAEHTGLIRPLTDFVLRRALHQSAAWTRAGLELTMAVNVSVRNLLDPELADKVESALGDAGVAPDVLRLEITESSIMADPEHTMGSLGRLSALGVTIAVDDFGTGYSSLAYLQRLPVDQVKIDKSFILNMSTHANDALIVGATVDLARSLGLTVLAEGVEDYSTWQRLRALGCDYAQGYLVSRPLPAAQLESWLAAWPAGIRPMSTTASGDPDPEPSPPAAGTSGAVVHAG
jgi:diguanylate cyclase (GGDEF)-like protein